MIESDLEMDPLPSQDKGGASGSGSSSSSSGSSSNGNVDSIVKEIGNKMISNEMESIDIRPHYNDGSIKEDPDQQQEVNELSFSDRLRFMTTLGGEEQQIVEIYKIVKHRLSIDYDFKKSLSMVKHSPGGIISNYLFSICLRFYSVKDALSMFVLQNIIGLSLIVGMGVGSHLVNQFNNPIWNIGMESGLVSAGIGILISAMVDSLQFNIKTTEPTFLTKLVFIFVIIASIFETYWIYIMLGSIGISILFYFPHQYLLNIVNRRRKMFDHDFEPFYKYGGSEDIRDDQSSSSSSSSSSTSSTNDLIKPISQDVTYPKNQRFIYAVKEFFVPGEMYSKSLTPSIVQACVSLYIVSLALVMLFRFKIYPNSLEADLVFQFFLMGSLIVGGSHLTIPLMFLAVQGSIRIPEFFKGFTLVHALPGSVANFAGYLGASTTSAWIGIVLWISLTLPSILINIILSANHERIQKSNFMKNFFECLSCASLALAFAKALYIWSAGIMTYEFALVSLVVVACIRAFKLSYHFVIILSIIIGEIVQIYYYPLFTI
ncbi:hypothetical protein DFA_09475 [Cavenderia fasciculata]|uniref:Uncharacterized protein n=1 Tax=Cavenderia fasciculata TaxID=261658 RepID=F4Q7Q7_CACFS|nr:uncharacterized protein DFA_09475 [Cavenderia fasciculata]EGG15807.1 hypothetical protein DFA_09475 [Cavenderia fasciculata]|eukprot:XP_004352132.1 hypothetical protein DFA_09475 [Cavenderia fasciculata]